MTLATGPVFVSKVGMLHEARKKFDSMKTTMTAERDLRQMMTMMKMVERRTTFPCVTRPTRMKKTKNATGLAPKVVPMSQMTTMNLQVLETVEIQ